MAKYGAQDIFRHAMEIEEAGEKFYRTLSEVVDDEHLRKIFQAMANQELKHRQTYRAFMETLHNGEEEAEREGIAADFDEQRYEQLRDKIFNRMEKVTKVVKLKTLGEALNYMIETECDAVDLFEQLQKLVTADERPQITHIINEERSHVKQLTEMRHQHQSVNLK